MFFKVAIFLCPVRSPTWRSVRMPASFQMVAAVRRRYMWLVSLKARPAPSRASLMYLVTLCGDFQVGAPVSCRLAGKTGASSPFALTGGQHFGHETGERDDP